MKQFLSCCFTLLLLVAQAQRPGVTDSLLQVLKKDVRIDSLRVKNFRDLSFAFCRQHNTEMGLRYADSALATAQKLPDNHKWLGIAYSVCALNYWASSRYQEALDKYQKAATHSEVARDMSNLGITYHNIGLLYNSLGEYRKAIDYHEKAYGYLVHFPDKYKALAALNSTGANYLYLSNYPKAAEYYLKTLKLAEKENVNEMIGISYENLGGLYKRTGDYQKASSYFEKALDIYTKTGDKDRAANTYNLYGTAKDQEGDSKGAIELYRQGLKLVQETQNEPLKYDLINNSGISYLALKEYENALSSLKQSIAYYKQSENLWKLSIAYIYYAKTLLEAPDDLLQKEKINPVNKYDIAVSLLQESITAAQEDEALNEEMEARHLLSEAYAKSGNFEKALSEYKKATALKDSIVNDQTNEDILAKEMQYDADKKQLLASVEINRQKLIRNVTIAGSIIVLAVGLVLFIAYRQRQKAREERKELLLRARISDIELKALRAQMNPHFIFNSLNSIADYLHKNDPKTADYYLAKFARLMRGILEYSEEKEISLTDELKILDLYLQLEQSRLRNKFSYEIKIASGIQTDTILVPPLIIQPFVENSIWHGLSPKEGDGKLLVEIAQENELLHIRIEDNGVGRKNSDTTGKSYGIKLTKERIALLDQQPATNTGVFLTDLTAGTRVEIKLPVIKKYEL